MEYHNYGDIKNFSLYTCVNYLVDDTVKEAKAQHDISNIVKESDSVHVQGDVKTSSLTHDKGITTLLSAIAIAVICIVVLTVKSYARKQKLFAAAQAQRVNTNSLSDPSNEATVSIGPAVTIKLDCTKQREVGNLREPTNDNESNKNMPA